MCLSVVEVLSVYINCEFTIQILNTNNLKKQMYQPLPPLLRQSVMMATFLFSNLSNSILNLFKDTAENGAP